MGAETPGQSRKKLRYGFRLWLSHPRLRYSCKLCQEYQITADGVETEPGPDKPLLRIGPTPCMSCPKVPAWAQSTLDTESDMRAAAWELDERNRAAIDHYYRMKAVGWPEPSKSDPLCQWYAGIITELEDEHAELARSGDAAATAELGRIHGRLASCSASAK